ncbi:hypothetical protein [uncultured Psychrobacter sp.]|uniref:hypothetical protein n=1 Tax=uncultured Psychrobacter sp. TaxID=259303 RepID=UPI00345B42A4
MNDLDNNDAGNIIDQVYSTPTPAKKAARNNDIYERFINRVQNIDSQANKKNKHIKHSLKSEETLSYESLSLEAPLPSDKPESTVYINDSIDKATAQTKLLDIEDNLKQITAEVVSRDAEISIPNTINPELSLEKEVISEEKETISKEQIKKNKGIKLLIISLICVSLILINALVFMAMYVSNKVTTSSNTTEDSAVVLNQPLATTNLPAPANISDSQSETQTAAVPVVESEPITSLEATKTPTIISPEKKPKKAASTHKLTPETEPLNAKRESDSSDYSDDKTSVDAAISLEDFKEEAQSTLYREINN